MPDLLPMAVLLIQHKITDLDVWLETYAKYASEREQAGVNAAHILQPDDDPQYIVVIHFFDTADAAEEFRTSCASGCGHRQGRPEEWAASRRP